MKKFLFTLAFLAALNVSSAYADRIIRRYDDRTVYYDSWGEYHWQVIEREVWIPERRVNTPIGSRIIPGRYGLRTDRLKVYHKSGRYNNRHYEYNNPRGKKPHPHGMPPGQRKKQDNRYDRRNRDWGYDRRDREYESRRSTPGQILEEVILGRRNY